MAGGALVVSGGDSLLFGVLAAVALVAAAATMAVVPHGAPVARSRSSLVDLVHRVVNADFLRPVLILGGATAALSAG
ncbi:MAG: hypothetical protein ACRDY1_06425 [Acidimicrobiales bacterium]